jgi:hypothetical protein
VTRPPAAGRLAAAGLAWLALFSLLFTVGNAAGLWPPPPEGGFSGVDLAAGLAFGVALLVSLVVGRP